MRLVLYGLCVLFLVSCGDSGGSSGSSGSNGNTPPTAQNVTIDAGVNDSVTYDLSLDIGDVETANTKLVIEVVDKPKYSTTVGSYAIAGELTENCSSDSNQTGKIVWNNNTEFFYEICDGSGFIGSVYFTYRVKDEQGAYSETKTVTVTNIADS